VAVGAPTPRLGQPGPGLVDVRAVILVAAAATPTTTLPGAVITIVGGPNATANIVGPHNDPADFYGIIAVAIAIALAILLARLLLARRGPQQKS
jgi:hypothetical protein